MDAAPFTGYVYPNEGVIQWSVLIVIYPYLTGLVAGAFTVSSFYHVFGMQRFKPVARLALLTSLCVMIFVPLPRPVFGKARTKPSPSPLAPPNIAWACGGRSARVNGSASTRVNNSVNRCRAAGSSIAFGLTLATTLPIWRISGFFAS